MTSYQTLLSEKAFWLRNYLSLPDEQETEGGEWGGAKNSRAKEVKTPVEV